MTNIYLVPETNNVQYLLDSGYTALSGTLVLDGSVDGVINAPGVCVVDRVDSSGKSTPTKRTYYSFTGASGNSLTGVVSVDGDEQDHNTGAIVEFVPDVVWAKGVMDALMSIFNSSGVLDTTKIVTPTGTQTLTNKTITSPTITTPSLTTFSTLYGPSGFLLNGKISPTVTSNNLTLAIKTLSGGDPSASDPVYVRIGDTVRTISSALSVTANAGTNWFNSGSAMTATKELDYAVLLGYNATDGVTIGFSRRFDLYKYSSFSTTTTDDKYCAISTTTNASATDPYTVIGRFAATLSAGAGYTWSVPTFTSENLVQRPIYETRDMSFAPSASISGFGGTAPTTPTDTSTFKIRGNRCLIKIKIKYGVAGATNTGFNVPMPVVGAGIASEYLSLMHCGIMNAAGSNPANSPSMGALWGTGPTLYAQILSGSTACIAILATGEYELV